MGQNDLVGISARNLALRIVVVFLVGTLAGSLVPELGNVVALTLGMPHEKGHFFNPYFLAVGIIGFGLACAAGYRKSK